MSIEQPRRIVTGFDADGRSIFTRVEEIERSAYYRANTEIPDIQLAVPTAQRAP